MSVFNGAVFSNSVFDAGSVEVIPGTASLTTTTYAPITLAPYIAATLITHGQDSTDSLTYTTASVTPVANLGYFLVIACIGTAARPLTPSISGCNLTWTNLTSFAGPGTLGRTCVFLGVGGSPTTGAITMTFSTNTVSGCHWGLVELTNIDRVGTNAFVQTGTQNGTTATPSITLGSFSSVNNATFGFWTHANQAASALGTGYSSLLNEAGIAGGSPSLVIEWRRDNDTTVDLTWPSSGSTEGGIGAEVKFAASQQFLTPAPASLVLTAFAPTVHIDVKPTPGTASLTLTAFAPSVLIPLVLVPGTASLATTRYPPTVSTPKTVTPGTAHLILTGNRPTIQVKKVHPSRKLTYLFTGSGLLTFSGAATVTKEVAYTGSGTLNFTGSAPTESGFPPPPVEYDNPTSGGIIFSGQADIQVEIAYTGSGTLLFGGAAAIQFQHTIVIFIAPVPVFVDRLARNPVEVYRELAHIAEIAEQAQHISTIDRTLSARCIITLDRSASPRVKQERDSRIQVTA